MGILSFLGLAKGDPDGYPAIERAYPNKTEPRVITVWSSKGGVGKTTLTVNLVSYLAHLGRSVVVVDVDEFGDAEYMSMKGYRRSDDANDAAGPEWFWSRIADVHSIGDLRPFLVQDPVTGHMTLPPQSEVDPAKRLGARAYGRMTEVLLRHFDVVVFDCGPSYRQEDIRYALRRCDCLVSPFTQNAAMLRNFHSAISELSSPSSGVGGDKMVLVLNSYRKVSGVLTDVQAKELFSQLCRSVEVVPFDPRAGNEAATGGRTFMHASSNKAVKEAYRSLTQSVLDVCYGKGSTR